MYPWLVVMATQGSEGPDDISKCSLLYVYGNLYLLYSLFTLIKSHDSESQETACMHVRSEYVSIVILQIVTLNCN